ncbi:hypothetical protein OV079_40620 [Nannocystis pusilla]|uniref:Uncharacterized protein n=1 Tax=Nannocystis pusilla TaxID=889268 RepID=A0A9X3EY86_9BACT|nr:hypothetical protein [Nannocystis pusilla]MCY1011754.1 hypothetical protein [Nannocystis pusilla]
MLLVVVASPVAVSSPVVASLADSLIPPSLVDVGAVMVVAASVSVPVGALAPVVVRPPVIVSPALSVRPSSPHPLSAPHSAVVQPSPRKLVIMPRKVQTPPRPGQADRRARLLAHRVGCASLDNDR